LLFALLAIIYFSFAGSVFDIYRSLRRAKLSQMIWPVCVSWAIAVFTLLLQAYFLKSSNEYSRIVIGVWFFITPIILVVWRLTIRNVLSYFRAKGYNTRSVAIVGAGDMGGIVSVVLSKKLRHID